MRVITTFEGLSGTGAKGFHKVSKEDWRKFWESPRSKIGEITRREATRIYTAMSRSECDGAEIWLSTSSSISKPGIIDYITRRGVSLDYFIRSKTVRVAWKLLLHFGWDIQLSAAKDSDDWWWVSHHYCVTSRSGFKHDKTDYYKCDQVEGLLELLSHLKLTRV
jgi:hypothetical protein